MVEPVKVSDSIAYWVYRAARLLRRNLVELATTNGYDLTPEQWFVLNRLYWEDGRSQVELSDGIFSDRPNMTRIVQVMERRGLVKRKPDPEDGRRQRVYITKRGRTLHDGFSAVVTDARERLLGDLSAKDVAATRRVLAALEAKIIADE